MTYAWSARSKAELDTCDPRLQLLFDTVLKTFVHDTTVIEGVRSDERQEEMYRTGRSHLRAGESKHNATPSLAVDVAPLVNGRILWSDRELWIGFAGFVIGTAAQLDIGVRWGGDWDGDWNMREHSFWDAPHWELLP